MSFYPVSSSEIRAALRRLFRGFDDDAWHYFSTVNIATGEDAENEGSYKEGSYVDGYKTAYAAEDKCAKLAGRDPDFSQAWHDLGGDISVYLMERSGENSVEDHNEAHGHDSIWIGSSKWMQKPVALHDSTSHYASDSHDDPDAGESGLRPEEFYRMEAFALCQAIEASKWDWVKEFREKLGPAGLVAHDMVYSYLAAPALRLLSFEDFSTANANTVDPRASLIRSQCKTAADGWQTFVMKFPAVRKKYTVRCQKASARSLKIGQPVDFLQQTKWQGHYARLTFYPGSVFEGVMETASQLAEHTLWQHEDAVVFLLTGRPPEPCLDVQFRSVFVDGKREEERTLENYLAKRAERIIMDVPAWLPADILNKRFKSMQRSIQGAENRPLSKQHLRLFCFVLTQRIRLGILGKGTEEQRRSMWEAWNLWCCDPLSAWRLFPETETRQGQWAGLEQSWKIEDFAYFNTICKRIEERLWPHANR